MSGLAWLGTVTPEPSCIVADDPGEVVRHAAPLDERARAAMREQHIERLLTASRRRVGRE